MRAGATRFERGRWVAFVIALSSLGVCLQPGRAGGAPPTPADAATGAVPEDEQARAFFEIGAQAYERGRFSEAIEAFTNAYARAPRPGLLFSIAQAHRRAFVASGDTSQLASAVEHYRAYLASPPPLPRKRDAELALARLVRLARSAARAEVDDRANDSSRLMVSTGTPGALVQIDGGEAITTLPHVATIAPGTHEVTLTAPGHAKQTRQILVPAGAAFALDVDLQPLPGSLSLTGLDGSEVWLDGRLVAGLPVERLPVGAGPHQLVVRTRGRLSYGRRIQVAPERDTRLDVVLEYTRQRYVSWAFLAASGACLLSSGVLALVSLREQGVARNLADTRDQERPLLASELDAYERAARQRDRYRAASIGTGLAGAGLGIVGALLFAFDTPPVPSAPRPEGDGVEAPAIEALTGFDSSVVGWRLRGQF